MTVMPELGASNEGARSRKVSLRADEVDARDWSGKMQALG
jgi:hypothetical protein